MSIMNSSQFGDKINEEPITHNSNGNDEESFVILGSSPPVTMNHISAENSITACQNSLFSNNSFQIDPANLQKNESKIFPSISYPTQNLSVQLQTSSVNIRTMSIDEIQEQFNMLIQENSQMKENLLQNNNDLRREFNKIMKYQEEVRKIHEDHRAKFEETRILVNKLKTENASLKESLKSVSDESKSEEEIKKFQEKIEHLTCTFKALQAENENLKNCSAKSTSLMSDKVKEIDKLNLLQSQFKEQIILLKSEKTDLERELERTNLEMKIVTERKDEMKTTIDKLKTQVASLMENQHKSETTIVDLNSEIKLYKEQLQKAHMKLCSDKSDYEMVSSSPDGNSGQSFSLFNTPTSSSEKITILQEEIQDLQNKLKEASVNKVNLSLEPVLLSVNHDFSYSESGSSDFEKKIQIYDKYMRDVVLWYNDHFKRMNLLQYILKDLQPENISSIEQVQNKLMELKKLSNDLCDNLSKEWICFKTAQSNFQTIYNEYVNLIREMESVKTTNNVNEDVHKKEVENLTNRLLQKDELIKLKCNELERIQREINQLNNDQSEIEVLKQQLDLYKEDFESERKARTTLAGENESLKSDLRRLQQRSEDLLQRLRHEGHNEPSAPSESSAGDCSTAQIIYPCPLCQFAFHDVRALENHVERCLDIQQTM